MPTVSTYKQHPPFCLQVELVEGCNLRCSFCGLNGIRGRENNFKFLTVELAQIIVDRLNEASWAPRIEFAMHGEPTMSPDMIEILRRFREGLPDRTHLMMTSNGAGLIKNPTKMIDGVMNYLNVLALDKYEGVSIVDRLVSGYRGRLEFRHYPQDKGANPHKRRPNEKLLVIVEDISEATKGTHSTLNNHAGAGAPPNENAQGKRCAKPFRELSIRWDGNIAICCNDWRGVFKVGNVADSSLDQLWNGKRMRAARKKLYHGERDFGPCKGCDAVSYRPGLLPDQRGKSTLPRANSRDLETLREACEGAPYTLPVLRDWEASSGPSGA